MTEIKAYVDKRPRFCVPGPSYFDSQSKKGSMEDLMKVSPTAADKKKSTMFAATKRHVFRPRRHTEFVLP